MEERIRIIIEGEHSDATQSVESVKGGLSGLGTVAGAVATGGLLLAATAITGIATAAVGAGVAALDVANDINNATNKIATQLGISQDAAGQFEDVMKGVFANNFGEDFDDIAQSISEVVKQLGSDMSDAELQKVTEQALALRDAFGIEVTESMGAVNTLMRDFGLTSQEALDFVTKGLQTIPADDLLDSITEYGPQFKDLKLGAGEFFSAMETGAANGVLGTDKILDLFKEMRLRLADLSGPTGEALTELANLSGAFDAEKLMAGVTDGTISMQEYFETVQEGLKGVQFEGDKTRLGGAILGTQFEDMGAAIVEGVDLAKTSMADLAGATDTLNAQYDNFGSMWSGIKRQALLALEPLGDALLNIGQQVMPLVTDFMSNTLQPALEKLGGFVKDTLAPAISGFSSTFGELGRILFGVGGDVYDTNDAIRDFLFSLGLSGDTVDTVESALTTLEGVLGSVRSTFNEWLPTLKSIGEWLAGVGSTALSGYGSLWSTEFKIIGAVITSVVNAVSWLSDKIQAAWGVISDAFADSNLGESIGELKQAFADLWAALGPVFASMGEIITTNFGTISEVLGEVFGSTGESVNWAGVLVNVFNIIALNVTNLAKTIAVVAGAISAFWTAHGETVVKVFTTAYKVIAGIIGTALSVVINVVKFFLNVFGGDWGKAFGNLTKITKDFDKFLGKLFKELTAFILKLIKKWLTDLLKPIIKTLDDIRDSFKEAWDFIEDLIDDVTDSILRLVRQWLDSLEKVIDNTLDAIQNLWESIWNSIKSFTDNILKAIENIFKSAMDSIEGLVEDALDAIQDTFTTVLNAIKTFVNNALNAIENIFDNAMDAIEGIVDDALNAIEDIFTSVLNAIRTTVTNALNAIENIFDNALDSIEGIVDDALDGIQNTFTTVLNAIKSFVDNTLTAIENIFGTSLTSIRNNVDSVFNTIENIIDSAMSAIRSTIDNAFNNIRNIVDSAMSTIRNLIQSGWDTVNNLVSGAFDTMRNIAQSGMDAVRNVVNTALQALANLMSVGSSAYNAVVGIGSSIANTIVAGFNAVTTFVSSITSKLIQWLNSVGFAFLSSVSAAGQVGSNIVSGILSGISSFAGFVSNVASSLSSWIGQVYGHVTGLAQLGWDMLSKIMNSLINGIGSWLNQFTNAIEDFINDAICQVIGCSPRGSITDRLIKSGGKIISSITKGIMDSGSGLADGLKQTINNAVNGVDAGGLTIPMTGDLGLNGLNLSNLGGVGVNSAGSTMTVIHVSPTFETTITDRVDKEEFIADVKDAIDEIVDRHT